MSGPFLHRNTLLLAAVERLAAARELDEIVRIVRETVRLGVGAHGICLILREGEQVRYVAEDAVGPLWLGRSFPMSGCISGTCIARNGTIVIADTLNSPLLSRALYAATFARSMAITPIAAAHGDEQPAGALAAYWERAQEVQPAAIQALEIMARAVARALEMARLIEALSQGEAQLGRSETRYRALVEALPKLFWTTRPDGACEYLSRQWIEYTGVPEAEQLGLGWLEALHPDDRERAASCWRRAVDGEGLYDLEYRIRGSDGIYRWFSTRGIPVRDPSGRIEQWIGTSTDIDAVVVAREMQARSREELERQVALRTCALEDANRKLQAEASERSRAEARLAKAERIEAVGQLTSGVAHDFNNLLTVILGNLDFLERRAEGAQDEPMRVRLETMRGAAERGAQLTRQLLAFSSRQRLEPKATDLNVIVAGLGSLLPAAMAGGISVEIVKSDALWPALVDPAQMEMTLLNLALNARDAMEVGGRLTVETANRPLDAADADALGLPASGDFVAVAVTDTGTGMAPAILARAFEPFFTTKPPGRGSGLGLSQVYGFARQSGGTALIRSAQGEGTTVTVLLPRASASAPALPMDEAPTVNARRGKGKPLLLLVDDDAAVREVTATILSEAGYDVLEASNGAEALSVLQDAAALDLVITDFAMPGMSGAELARQITGRHPGLPVLFVTGYADLAGLGDIKPERILLKPFRRRELLARVAGLLLVAATAA